MKAPLSSMSATVVTSMFYSNLLKVYIVLTLPLGGILTTEQYAVLYLYTQF
jgi:hypothetical protein